MDPQSLLNQAYAKILGGWQNANDWSRQPGNADLLRSAVEGTAHNLRRLLPVVERFTGEAVDDLVFFGGAARSSAWAQVLADVLDRPISALADPGRAVARAVGLVALARRGDVPDDPAAFVRVAAIYDPTPSVRDVYDHVHPQFVAAFDALRPVFHALNEAERS